MKQLLLLLLCFSTAFSCEAQAFKRITDPTNPVTNFTNTNSTYKGLAWVDLNRDHYPDLFVSPWFLFLNDRHGNFTQLPNLPGVRDEQIALGTSWGDLDNDGDMDCAIAAIQSGLFLNAGDNTFTSDNAQLPGIDGYSGWDCALADVDNNGLLDLLYVHACCGFHPSGPFNCKLFLQQTAGVFTPVTGYEFTDQTAPYTIPTWSDYDQDGDLDLFIGSGPAGTARPDFNYKNLLKETGVFQLERLTSFPFMQPQDGQVYNFIDYDNDRDLDICLTNYGGAKTRLYRNNGDGTYLELNTVFSTVKPYLSNVWGDMDNDGYLDVLLAEDQTNSPRLFRNKGNGTFHFPIIPGGTGGNIAGIALADYDNDGDLDFYVNGQGNARTLFRNDTFAAARRWVQFALEGSSSNRAAIGAAIQVKATIGGKAMWQIREVLAHNSFQSQSDLRQHFGLKDATQIDSVVVRWPSGIRQVFTGLSSNQFYQIKESTGIEPIVGTTPVANSLQFETSPNPVRHFFNIQTNEKITALELFDSTGRLHTAAFDLGANGSTTVHLPQQLPNGLLFLRATFEHGRQHLQKIVKEE